MSIIDMFKSKKFRKWISLNKDAENALNNFKKYFEVCLEKIGAIQYITLRIFDFENQDFVDMKSGFFKQTGNFLQTENTAKLNKHFFRLIKSKINKMIKAISKEVVLEKKEEKEMRLIDEELPILLSESEEMESERVKITEFKRKFEQLKENLIEQRRAIKEFHERFNIFYKETNREHHEDISRDMIKFKEELSRCKDLLKSEVHILTGVNLDDNVANWHVEVSNHLEKTKFFKNMTQLLKRGKRIYELFKARKISLYHGFIGKRRKILPLKESVFEDRFYVCKDDPHYAKIIKICHTRRDPDVLISITEIEIPEKIFNRLFKRDFNPGTGSVEDSDEAYDHAYYLPVSRFPIFNYYVYTGVITEK